MAVPVGSPDKCLPAQLAFEISRCKVGAHVVLYVAELVADQPAEITLQLLLSSAMFFGLRKEANDVLVDSVQE